MFRDKTAVGWIITAIAIAMSAFHLYIAWFGPP
jgi:hypothetical protein